jgi:hypothetical protein
MNMFRTTVMLAMGVLPVLAFQAPPAAPAAAQQPAGGARGAAPAAQPAGAPAQPGGRGNLATSNIPGAKEAAAKMAAAAAAPHTLSPYFVKSTALPKAPDAEGFLQRWLLLEPINKPNRGNTVFTGKYVRDAFNTEYFPNQFTVIPKDGDKVKVGDQELAWHALDSTGFNVKLFRFAYGVNKQTYGVIFWAVTVVNSPREMENVRLAAGSNASSIWWVNGKEAVDLFDDRRMVADDVVSKRLTLNKGKNILRGAVINGPGLSDFCVRFIDEKGQPIKDLTLTLQ